MTSRRRAWLYRTLSPLGCALILCLYSAGCTKHIQPVTKVQLGSSTTVPLAGITACDGASADALSLDPARPLVVLVHGCHSSNRSFESLAKVFAVHDQQTVCYRYDDRASVSQSASGLRSALEQIATRLQRPEILVFGHSQGGLVARAALSQAEGEHALPGGNYRLVTVSSPFGGIRAAKHCGSVLYHIASLGVTVGVCRAIAGAKWNEIHPGARMVRLPPELAGTVREHLTIVTDERDTCRRYSADGKRCEQDDFVFTVAEQHNARIERDQRVVRSSIAAGHVEVVGAHGSEPKKLLRVLQAHGMLRETRPEEELAVERLTARLGW
jgi:pimeloyl-ACP methyl ester carboxylesterase